MNGRGLLGPPRRSWIGARDPRLRIVAALVFAAVTVSLTHPTPALGAFGLAAVMAFTSGPSLREILQRLAAVESFLATVLLTLPFTVPGETLAELGSLVASREGLLKAVLILLKSNAVVLSLLSLVGSMEPMMFGHALARLGVSTKLVHLLLLTVRQIHLLHGEFVRLREAMRARAFVPRSDRHTWRSYGWLVGMLLVRSLARARRITAAMRCRGFQGRLYLLDAVRWEPADTKLAAGLLVLFAALPVLDSLA